MGKVLPVSDKRVALGYRLISLVISLAGFITMTGLTHGQFTTEILMFYTMQSNIFAILLFALLAWRTWRGIRRQEVEDPGYYPKLVMVTTVILLITFLVYWVMLAPQMFTMAEDFNQWSFGNLAVHGITPLLILFDYTLFSVPGRLRYRDIYLIAIYPLAYFVFTTITGLLGFVYYISPLDDLPVRYPYFFFDFDRIGWLVFAYLAGLIAFFLGIGHLLYFIDKRRARKDGGGHSAL
ncbi:MAG: Pr6Pr family membrane protein [Promicromonosporaceae bacterium]|nr:Pr6Pr family membrane protein [Promicromonosporaceae bacterium]